MLKSLLFVAIIAILAFVGIKSTLGEKVEEVPNKAQKEENPYIKKEKTNKNKEFFYVKDEIKVGNIVKKDSDFDNKVDNLFKTAYKLVHENNYEKALEMYDEIVSILLNMEDNKKNLKRLAKAYSLQAYIHENYSKSVEKAINAYDKIINLFRHHDNEELLLIYYKAQIQKSYLVDSDESIAIYDEIIDKFKNSTNPKLLDKFASAQFEKTHLLSAEESIDVYDEVIEKLKNSSDKKLLKQLSIAQFSKAYILNDYLGNKMDAIDVYDEIIDRFGSYEDNSFQVEVINALFYKSFLLMNDYKQESMDLFDEIIDRCKITEQDTVPTNFEFSVINNIELALITNCDDSKYRELADKYLSNVKDIKPQLEMLTILKRAQDYNQDEAIKEWKKKYADYRFENWTFEVLESWNSEMEDIEMKKRIRRYLDEFIKQHKKFDT